MASWFDPRWLSATGGVVMEGAAGTSYAFGVYSGDLKERLNLTQPELQTVAAVGNVGLYLTFFSGFAFDYFGPLPTSIVAAVLTLTGYLVMWASASGRIPSTVGVLSVAAFIWSHGSSWGDLAAVSVQTRNFPQNRGLVIGVLKSFFGLSATIFAVSYDSLFPDDPSSFLLFMAVVVPSLLLLGGLCQRLAEERDAVRLSPAGTLRMFWGYLVVVAVALFASVTTVLIKTGDVEAGNAGWFAGLIGIMVGFACLALPIFPCHRDSSAAREGYDPVDHADGGSKEAFIAPEHGAGLPVGGGSAAVSDTIRAAHLSAGAAGALNASLGGDRAEVVTDGAGLCEGVASLDFWLIVFLLFGGTGSGLTLINNISQLAKAIGAGTPAVYVAMLGVGNAFGRMAFGAASDAFRARLTRPGWLTISVSMMAVGMLITAFADPGALYFSVILCGFAYGGFWSLLPAILADRFGTRAFATLYAFVMLAPAVGSVVLGEVMASAFYDAHVTAGSNDCIGQECFQATFLILCGICVVAAGIGGYLTWKLRGHYRAMLAAAGELTEEDLAEAEADEGGTSAAIGAMGGGENLGAVLGRAGWLKDSPLDTPELALQREKRRKRRERRR
ncbi:hypothetical protein FNF29_00481 [Cafeteria roenbergensis]|uniref:Uncharacterized protein n=1 Tax=Cafeteria roenbergensis TaxID=33653 RepID=A0A5A8CWT2_CAFRO|nr:hypothetical protein FNF28_07299 [Cafeteria roenbergensis]KAA0157129.1 hypothetical protein FNF29_00481 [Cafeteria roenbergensis]KAA0168967.1 hypothetical protein FNF31_00128 [Cafeteria roenbergensis]|eukprot:KAA0157129.1 hypothetical protein FNF29_00481 [Cafeteria roenbergensis]